MQKRFANHTDEEVLSKRQKTTPANTQKMNCHAAETLRKYLIEKRLNPEFVKYTSAELADGLGKCYLGARSVKGEQYKTSTLDNLRHGLNIYLKAPPHNKLVDILLIQLTKTSKLP